MKLLRLLFILLLLLALGVLAAGGLAWHWVHQPVEMAEARADFHIAPGSGARNIARRMAQAGIRINEDAFVLLARGSGHATQLQAGAYEAKRGDTPWTLLTRMASGDTLQLRLTLVEGWTYQRIRQALRDTPVLRQTLAEVSDRELLERLGAAGAGSPEGLFFPDTYVHAPGDTDFDILRRAYQAQKELLDSAWAQRAPDLPLKTPYEALILASIVEKETGHAEDRGRVAGVFINRLRIGMPLQTDPTVIYGMGEAYQGRLRRRDLTADTPWNTYTRGGLPPTPIANPGLAALQAALHPEVHQYLYFVSRGDGTSEFSRNLAAHNRAVAKYILGRNP